MKKSMCTDMRQNLDRQNKLECRKSTGVNTATLEKNAEFYFVENVCKVPCWGKPTLVLRENGACTDLAPPFPVHRRSPIPMISPSLRRSAAMGRSRILERGLQLPQLVLQTSALRFITVLGWAKHTAGAASRNVF